MAKIICISGWKRSGKDTCADYLVKERGYTRLGFADILKNMVAEQYNIPRSHCDDVQYKEKPIMHLPVIPKDNFSATLAHFLFKEYRFEDGTTPVDRIFYGDASQGGFRGLRSPQTKETLPSEGEMLYWTPRALCILEGSVKRSVRSDYWVSRVVDKVNFADIVISDIRYKSEVQELKKAFGNEVVLIRVNRFDTCTSTDPSERDLDNYDFQHVIENRGSLEELYLKLDRIVSNGNS